MVGYSLVPPSLGGTLACELIRWAGAALSAVGHRGFWQAAQLAGRVAPRRQQCIVSLGDGVRLQIDVRDHYWSRLLAQSYVYEPEIWFILRSLPKDIAPLLLDCGANFGFWSVVLSGPDFGWKVIAIEASPKTFERLDCNRHLNGDRFTALNRAIFSVAGRHVTIDSEREHHSAASISTAGSGSDVVTTTIDQLVAQYAPAEQIPIIVKLDVEGVEIDAIQGASAALQRNTMVVYEDHGNEPSALVTQHILQQPDLRVYFVTQAKSVIRIHEVAEARQVKTDVRNGYNFFAVKAGSSFDAHLDGLVTRPIRRP